MALVTCPECAAEISNQAAVCPVCGKSNSPSAEKRPAAIRSMGGKLRAAGAVLVALAVIATVSGFWWGPALFLPGVAVFMFGMAA